LSFGESAAVVVEATDVRLSTSRESNELSILTRALNVKAGISLSGASTHVPAEDSAASLSSSNDGRRSNRRSFGINSGSRPLASSASNSSHLEGDRVTTAGVVSEVVKRETVGSLVVYTVASTPGAPIISARSSGCNATV
jgi:hypothetical protein